MNRITSVFFVVVIAFSSMGCGSKKPAASTDTTPDADTRTADSQAAVPETNENPSQPPQDDRALCRSVAECKVEMENEGEKPEDQVAKLTEECVTILTGKAPALRAAIHDCSNACGDCESQWDCVEMTDPSKPACEPIEGDEE